jgi:hypothetical protein
VPRLADRHFVIGETYPLAVQEARSHQTHAHFFAALNEAWQNLPADAAERFPTAEHLRKYALIRAGFRDERSIGCSSKAEAQRLAAFVRPMDDFAVVIPSEATVTVYTAKSQSMRAMGKAEFQRSKQAVLDVVSEMIGVKPAELHNEAGQAA